MLPMLRAIPGRLIDFCVKHAAVTAAATLAITLFFAFFALRVKINPDFVSFLPKNSAVNAILREYSGKPGTTDLLVLAVTAKSGSIFDIDKLSAYGQAIATIGGEPGVTSTVSPFNLVSFGREAGRLAIRTMSPGGGVPAADDLPEFRARLAGSGYAKNLVVSADSTMLLTYFQVSRASSHEKLMSAVNAETARPGRERPHAVRDRVGAAERADRLLSLPRSVAPARVRRAPRRAVLCDRLPYAARDHPAPGVRAVRDLVDGRIHGDDGIHALPHLGGDPPAHHDLRE